MCNNQCLKQWPRPVDVKDRLPTKLEVDEYGRILAWDKVLNIWAIRKSSALEEHPEEYPYWMRLPPNPEV